MIYGIKMIDELIEGLGGFIEKHDFKKLEDAVGKSLPYFSTHHHLVELQAAKREEKASARAARDLNWGEKNLADQTAALTSNE